MMNRVNIISISLCVIALLFALSTKLSAPKIAYVDSYKLLEEYEGMKEMQVLFKINIDAMDKKADSLQQIVESAYALLMQDSLKLSNAKKTELKQMIQFNTMKYGEIESSMENYTSNEVQAFSEGIIKQINVFIEEYGDNNGYDIILGMGEPGNIVYGTEKSDITQEILDGLNNRYLGNE